MWVLLTILVAVTSGALLLTSQLKFMERKEQTQRFEFVLSKVADQMHNVFNASYQYVSGIGTQPSSWSIQVLKDSKLIPATFDDRTSLGQTYQMYYVRNGCDSQVMDLVVKIEDTEDSENQRLWEKAGFKVHQLGKRYVYSKVVQLLKTYTYPKDMQNPCGAGLPPYEIGYILNGKVYVDSVERTDLNIPSSLLSKDGVFIYGYAPNQWGYLVVTFRFLRGDEVLNEYYDWTGSNQYKQLYSDEYPWWRQADIIWSKDCPSGYIDLSTSPLGVVTEQDRGWVNFCVPAFKSDLTKEKINRIRREFRKFYGVDRGLMESDDCVVVSSEGIRVSNDLTSFLVNWASRWCSTPDFPNVADLDREFRNAVSRWLYDAHKEAWGGRTRSWLQQNEPLHQYPNPNFWFFRSITFKDPLQNRYYQLVAYFYKFYTGEGCSPSSLGMNGTSKLTGFSYPPNATIWATGWKWARRNNPTDVGNNRSCSPSWLDDEYTNLGTSQRFTEARIILRVLDNSTDASQYVVPITWRNGKNGVWRTFNWVIPTPIY